MECYTYFTINHVTFIDSCQFMLSSLKKLSSNLSKEQFRESRKYLESFYIQQPNQPQTNNVTEGGEVGKPCTSMKTIEITFTNHQHSRQINNSKLKKTWCWWHKKEFTHMNIWAPLDNFKNHSYHQKTPSIAHQQKKTSPRQIAPTLKGCWTTSIWQTFEIVTTSIC